MRIRFAELIAFGLVACTVGLVATAKADRIVLRDGKVIAGILDSETRERVSIRTSAGVVSFPLSMVEKIERDPADQNALEAMAIALADGDVGRALPLVDRLTSQTDTMHRADELILAHAEKIVSNAADAPALDATRFATWVRERGTSAPDPLRLLLARFLAARGQGAAAITALRSISPEYGKASQQVDQLANQLLRAELQRAITEQNPQLGIESLATLQEIAPETLAGTGSVLLYLRQAGRLADQSDHREALRLLADQVAPIAPATALNEMFRVLDGADRTTSAAQQHELYLLVEDALSTGPMATELPEVYGRHARVLLRAGDFDLAENVAHSYSRVDADSGARLLHEIEFSRRSSRLSPDDAIGHYRLGVWAREMGLPEQAEHQFRRVAANPEVKENAAMQLSLLSLEREKHEFDTAKAHFDARRYSAAVEAASDFTGRYPKSELRAKASELAELARYAATQHREIRPAEADVVFQNAERLYLQDLLEQALAETNRIEVDYGDTPVAKKARDLRSKIRLRMRQKGVPEPAALITSGNRQTSRPLDWRMRSLIELQRLAGQN